MDSNREPVAPPPGEERLLLRDAVAAATGKKCEHSNRGLQLWMTRGLLDEKGKRHFLEGLQEAESSLWKTSVEAVRRFLEAVGEGHRAAATARLTKYHFKRKGKAANE